MHCYRLSYPTVLKLKMIERGEHWLVEFCNANKYYIHILLLQNFREEI